MCGIAGIISFKYNIDANAINRMTDVIKYRGPDDEGALTANIMKKIFIPFKRADEFGAEDRKAKFYFGHRRLSIIDLTEAGHQPMGYANNSLWITYNGEIYNYLEIKKELLNIGYDFKTNSDTEVILAAYHKWGEDCLLKFNGMWSFAILDIKNDKLFCSVDQFGIKPFFYHKNENCFSFASEIKQLFQLNWVEKSFNNNVVNVFGYPKINENSNTIFSNISKLEAGEKIVIKDVSSERSSYSKVTWFKFMTEPNDFSISEDKACEKFRELFYDSVKLRLRSDVPVGTALSGGVDSSLIVLTMNSILKESSSNNVQKTFTSGSEDNIINEIQYAKEVLKLTNAEGHFVIPNSEGFIEEFENMYYHIELPFISSTCYASWCVYKLAKANGVPVTLDGQGADETLTGYDIHMFPFYQIDFLRKGKWKNMRNNSRKITELYGLHNFGQINLMTKEIIKSNNTMNLFYENRRIRKETLFSKLLIENLPKFKGSVSNHNNRAKIKGYYAKILYDYLYNLSLPILLHNVDRTSMAHSVEARLPFLDYRLLNLIYSLPHDFKIRDGITKYILKRAFKNELPERIVNRLKLGFNTAEASWFKQQEKKINEYVNSNIDKLDNILNTKLIKEIFNNNNSINRTQKIRWDILSLVTISSIFEVN